jgi:hypothetical protein
MVRNSQQVSGVPDVIYKSVHFPDALMGYAAGASVILKTTDAGYLFRNCQIQRWYGNQEGCVAKTLVSRVKEQNAENN